MSGRKRAKRQPPAPIKLGPYKLRDLVVAVERFGVWGVGRSGVNLVLFCDAPGLPYALADLNPIRRGRRRAAHEWIHPQFGKSFATWLGAAELAFVATVGRLYVCDACKPLFAMVAEVHTLNQKIRRRPFPGRRFMRAPLMAERDDLLAEIKKERYVAQRNCTRGRPEQAIVWGSKGSQGCSTECFTVPSGTVFPAKAAAASVQATYSTCGENPGTRLL